jgi:LmbE family N-acetylglucosaminyl deacetylase
MVMIESLKGQKILVVVAHPDDELLGCGATFHKLAVEFGCRIRVVILGEGITSRSDSRNTTEWGKELEKHKQNIKQAKERIGYQELSTHDLPDNRFDSVNLLDIVKTVEAEKRTFKPSIVFTHHGGDVNIDHQRTFEAVITACRPMVGETVKTIITFETPSGTEWRATSDPRHFIPNLFFEVSEQNLAAKIAGMECYEYERREYPHPRSPQALRIQAQRWGVAVGCHFAEAFSLVRSIN